MIPYEELVAALARWRAHRGLPTGLGDYLGEPAAAAPASHGYGPGMRDHSHEDVVDLGDELLDGVMEESHAPAFDAYPDITEEGAQDGRHADTGIEGRDEPLEHDEMEFGALADESTQQSLLSDVAPPSTGSQPEEPKPQAKGRGRGRRRRK